MAAFVQGRMKGWYSDMGRQFFLRDDRPRNHRTCSLEAVGAGAARRRACHL